MIQIRRRFDGLYNVYKEEFLLPLFDLDKSFEATDIRASKWQTIAVCETHEEALKVKEAAR